MERVDVEIGFERLTDMEGDYCGNVCGMATCRRIKDTGKMCSDAYRYNRLREYEDIGLSPAELKKVVSEYNEMAVGKNGVT